MQVTQLDLSDRYIEDVDLNLDQPFEMYRRRHCLKILLFMLYI